MTDKYVVDISHWNKVNLELLKQNNKHITGIMIKCCQADDEGDMILDSKFDEFYSIAIAVGLDVGCYMYSVARTKEQMIQECNDFLQIIEGKKFTLPIVVDFEEQWHYDKSILNQVIQIAGSMVEEKGYYYASYLNKSLYSLVNPEVRQQYATWIADWEYLSLNLKIQKWGQFTDICMIQYGTTEHPIGAYSTIDMSIMMKDLPKIIRENKLNNLEERETCKCCECNCKCDNRRLEYNGR